MSRVVAIVACGLALAACSTARVSLTSAPPTQALRIESKPAGAEAKTSLGQSCRTPCELEVPTENEISLTLALNGYQPQTIAVRKEVTDSSQLAPNPINIELKPVPASPAKKKQAAAKSRPAVAANPAPARSASAQPAQAPVPRGAAPPEPVTPGPVETATSATDYPWPSR